MVRLLVLIALIFAFAFSFAWVADLPGDISILWLDKQIDINPLAALVALLVALAVLLIGFAILRSILKSPESLRRFFGRRRRDKGYDALSSALIALGSGDSVAAKRFSKDAKKQLKGAPVTRFLEAQVAQQEDRASDARAIYQDLTLDDHTRLLGLHGLFLEARRQGETEVAKHYAEQAVAIAPHLPWAGQALFELQCAERDWEAALKILEQNLHAKLVDRKQGRRLRAVLLTARAQELEAGEPERARKLALEAHGLAPELVPAAVIAGRVLARLGEVRKAVKVLEATWKKEAHPEIAEAYAHVRPGDSVQDRLKRVEDLTNLRANSPEGAMALARGAIDAGEWETARDALKRVFRSNPTQEAYMLMSELEEAEHGDRGRVREWLARAVRAPRDPAWTADGVVADEWDAISPVTGRLDAFEWKVPVDDRTEESGAVIEDAMLDRLPAPIEIPDTEEASSPLEDRFDEADITDIEDAPAEDGPAEHAPAGKALPAEAEKAEPVPVLDEDREPAAMAPDDAAEAMTIEAITAPEVAEDAAKPAPNADASAPDAAQPATEAVERKPDGKRSPRPVEFPLKNPPDDPGPKPRTEVEEKKRFSLFS